MKYLSPVNILKGVVLSALLLSSCFIASAQNADSKKISNLFTDINEHSALAKDDAETLEACQLLLVPRETIQDICARVPSAAQALTTSIAAILRRLTEEASDLVFLDLPRRVAKVLLSQDKDDDGVIRLHLRQEEIAHQVGGTRQSVNAALRGFERRGWIEVHDRAVTVTQVAALGRFAGN